MDKFAFTQFSTAEQRRRTDYNVANRFYRECIAGTKWSGFKRDRPYGSIVKNYLQEYWNPEFNRRAYYRLRFAAEEYKEDIRTGRLVSRW